MNSGPLRSSNSSSSRSLIFIILPFGLTSFFLTVFPSLFDAIFGLSPFVTGTFCICFIFSCFVFSVKFCATGVFTCWDPTLCWLATGFLAWFALGFLPYFRIVFMNKFIVNKIVITLKIKETLNQNAKEI